MLSADLVPSRHPFTVILPPTAKIETTYALIIQKQERFVKAKAYFSSSTGKLYVPFRFFFVEKSVFGKKRQQNLLSYVFRRVYYSTIQEKNGR